MYGHRSLLGSALIRAAAIMAVAIVFIGLLNRPDGNWGAAVNMTPHATTTDHSTPRVQ